jgi:hypothetical protein
MAARLPSGFLSGKQEVYKVAGNMVEISATPLKDIGANTAFTITCSAIAILIEVEYCRSLLVNFGRGCGFHEPSCAERGGSAGAMAPAVPSGTEL